MAFFIFPTTILAFSITYGSARAGPGVEIISHDSLDNLFDDRVIPLPRTLEISHLFVPLALLLYTSCDLLLGCSLQQGPGGNDSESSFTVGRFNASSCNINSHASKIGAARGSVDSDLRRSFSIQSLTFDRFS